MACLWVVCGAGRGVGKTWIARGLVSLLPAASYVKHGHGQARGDKPGRLLHHLAEVEAYLARAEDHTHVVLESNTVALQRRADLCIFVEGQPRGLPPRDDVDALRAAAHIVLDHDQPLRRWRAELARVLGDEVDLQPFLALLQGQVQRLPLPPIGAGTKLWLSLPGEHGMGKGLVQLLLQVHSHSTLRGAAQATGISYRHAWDMVRKAEKHLGLPLLISRPGGAGGGGTSLTPLGLRLVRAFEQLDRDLQTYANQRLEQLLGGTPIP
jgi:molybdate transport system regulatory protein